MLIYDDPFQSRNRDVDGVRALHDLESQAGEDDELDDVYWLDHVAARALGIELDAIADTEPQLD